MSVDILGTSCDQCRSMVQYSFTSTESRGLVRTDSPGRPPRLSHSSWTMRRRNATPTAVFIVCVPNHPPQQVSRSVLSPFLTGRMLVRPNILRTLRRTMIRFLIELLVRRIWFGQSKLYFVLNWLVMRCKLRPELAADAQQTAWSKM